MGRKDGSSAKETFPKISAECVISSCKKIKGGVDLRFDDLQITGTQFERVSDWIDEEAKLTVTIQQHQGSLLPDPPDKDKSMAATVAAEEGQEGD